MTSMNAADIDRNWDMRDEHYIGYMDLFALLTRWASIKDETIDLYCDHIKKDLYLAPRLTKGRKYILEARFNDTTTCFHVGDEKHPTDDPDALTFNNFRKHVIKMEDIERGDFAAKRFFAENVAKADAYTMNSLNSLYQTIRSSGSNVDATINMLIGIHLGWPTDY